MNPQPQRVYVSGPNLDSVPSVIVGEPHAGDPMQLFLENGKVMRTSVVTRVSRKGSELVVETQNSQYRVVPMAA